MTPEDTMKVQLKIIHKEVLEQLQKCFDDYDKDPLFEKDHFEDEEENDD